MIRRWERGAARRVPAGRAVAPATSRCASRSISVQQLQHDSWLSVVEGAVGQRSRPAPRPRSPKASSSRPRRWPRSSAEADGRVDHDRRLRHRLPEPFPISPACRSGREDRPALRPRHRENRNDETITQRDHCAVALAACAASPKASDRRSSTSPVAWLRRAQGSSFYIRCRTASCDRGGVCGKISAERRPPSGFVAAHADALNYLKRLLRYV